MKTYNFRLIDLLLLIIREGVVELVCVCEVWLLSVQSFMWKTLFHDIFPAHLLKLFDIHKALQTIWKFPGWCYLQNCPKYYLMIKQMSKFLIIISEINLSPFHFILVSLSTHWSFFLTIIDYRFQLYFMKGMFIFNKIDKK